jgi:hypothetical protein
MIAVYPALTITSRSTGSNYQLTLGSVSPVKITLYFLRLFTELERGTFVIYKIVLFFVTIACKTQVFTKSSVDGNGSETTRKNKTP